MDLPTEDLWGLNLTVYTGKPGSLTADALAMLASWAVTTPSPTVQQQKSPADETT